MLTGRRDVERRQDNLDRVCQLYTVYHSFSVYLLFFVMLLLIVLS